MAHGIHGERFVGMRTPGWHQIGTVLQEQVSAREALTIGGITYTYADAPMGFVTPDGVFQESKTQKVVLRSPIPEDPEWKPLGVVSTNYRYLQNEELALGLDTIAKETGWKFETVGALHDGKVIFITMDAGARDVRGDEYRSFILVADGKVAGRALSISVTPVRVVCQNTLSMADSENDIKIKISHGSNVHQDYSFWLRYVGALKAAQERTFDDLETMTRVQISDDQARRIIARAFPEPSLSSAGKALAQVQENPAFDSEELRKAAQKVGTRDQWNLDQARKSRELSFELYERFNSGEEQGGIFRGKLSAKALANLQRTPYAALQAITELVDWGSDAKGASKTAIFGEGAQVKRRAFNAALAASR